MSDFSDIFDQTCSQGKIIFERKNQNYSHAFRRMGLLGEVAEINGIAARMQSMLYRYMKTGELDRAKMDDLVLDLHNYSIIAKICMVEDNLIGSEYK